MALLSSCGRCGRTSRRPAGALLNTKTGDLLETGTSVAAKRTRWDGVWMGKAGWQFRPVSSSIRPEEDEGLESHLEVAGMKLIRF